MKQTNEYATKRRVGCVMWLAILAIPMSGFSLMLDTIQELAWDQRVEQASVNVAGAATADVVSIATPLIQNTPPSTSPTDIPAATDTPLPTDTPVAVVAAARGPTYEEVCGVEEGDMTEVQLQQYAQQFAGQAFTNWRGYVYDVQERDGQYRVDLADEPRGLFWTGNIALWGVPAELAVPLSVEQEVTFSGRIREVETTFGVICNPIVIDVEALVP